MEAIIAGVGIVFFLIILLGVITVAVFYLLTLSNLLKEISDENRQVPAVNVWLMFIPLFNLIYPFILYPKICNSTKSEFESRKLDSDGDFGKGLGLAMAILGIVGIIPVIGGIAGIAQLIIFIVFWVKMAGYKNTLKSNK